MSKSRKDDHIKLALNRQISTNDFDLIRLTHQNLSGLKVDDVNLKSNFLGYEVPYPFYINGMTGGTETAHKINYKLALIAEKFNIPMMSGSQSIMLKDKDTKPSFTVIKDTFKGIKVANLSANATPSQAKEAVEALDAKGLAIHLNILQELSMQEGDRDFSDWMKNLKAIKTAIHVPILIKEVGFGISVSDTKKLIELGFEYIDISGLGGTHFGHIEAQRSNTAYLFESFGNSTVDALIDHKAIKLQKNVKIYASGGIRNANDVIKALILGADMVGLSKWFLDLVTLDIETAFDKVEKLIESLKLLMVALGVKNIAELKAVSYRKGV